MVGEASRNRLIRTNIRMQFFFDSNRKLVSYEIKDFHSEPGGRPARSLMPVAWFVCSNCFVWHITDTALDAIVDADLAHRAERFVVKSWDTQRGP